MTLSQNTRRGGRGWVISTHALGQDGSRDQGIDPNSVAKESWRRVGHRYEEPTLRKEVFYEVQTTSMGDTFSLTLPESLGWEEGAVKFIQLGHVGSRPHLCPATKIDSR